MKTTIVGLRLKLASGMIKLLDMSLRIISLIIGIRGKPNTTNYVLVHRVGNLGDLLVVLPVLKALKDEYPEARIGLLTNKGGEGLPGAEDFLIGSSVADEIICYKLSDVESFSGIKSLRDRLSNKKIDLWVNLNGVDSSYFTVLRNFFFARWVGVRNGIGFRIKEAICFYPWVANLKHPDRVTFFLRLLKEEGINVGTPVFPIPLPDDLDKVKLILQECGGGEPLIGLCVSAKMPIKRWPIERFIAVCKGIIERYPLVKFVILGGADDAEFAMPLVKEIPQGVVVASGRISINGSAEVLRHCRLLISCDTGIAHLAAAVGIPVVGVYSRRDPKGKWNPYGKQHIIFEKDINCAGCLKWECPEHNGDCIKRVNIQEVIEAAFKLIDIGS